jgi:SAM-dependent methyltransferase
MSSVRQSAALVARQMGVLPVIEQMRYLKQIAKSYRANERFKRTGSDYVFPPLWLAYDAYNNLNFQRIFSEGSDQANRIVEGILAASPAASAGADLNILEWGCGPGRIIQHVRKALPAARLYGTDYNRRTIDWCKSALTGIEFAANDLAPPLPFETHAMDAIYSISVFTHLSEEMHFAWIKELARVLRPGGTLLVTVHGSVSADHSLTAAERAQFDAGKLVVRGNVLEGSRLYAAFQPDSFMSQELLKDFTVLKKTEPFAPFMRQAFWIARKN